MDKVDIQILIVEDDPTLGKSMLEMVKREGYSGVLTTKPVDAIAQAKSRSFHLAIIDCMLPKMNGRDLAVQLKADSGGKMPIILVSGVFKEKNYMRESIQQTGAFAYLTKPFNIEDLKKLITDELQESHDVTESMIPVYNLMARSTISAEDRIKAINESGDIHGFDLPWIFSLLLDKHIIGLLSIVAADGTQYVIGFKHGAIVQVTMSDYESFFGALLVDGGYVEPSDVEKAVSNPLNKKKRLGEVLVDMGLLSPHAIEIVLAEQQGVRLAKIIQDTSVKIQFTPETEVRESSAVTHEMFIHNLDDWILSKIPVEWLRKAYMGWADYTFVKGSEFSKNHKILHLVNIGNLPGLVDHILEDRATLQSVLGQYETHEAYALRALHALIVSRVFGFGSQIKVGDFSLQIKRFEKINQELDTQNHFERLGLSKSAKETEIKRAYIDLAKVLHPDKMLPGAPLELKKQITSAFEKVNQAYQVLSTDGSRANYLQELEVGSAELVFKAEEMLIQGKAKLRKGEVKAAMSVFEAAEKLCAPSIDLRLHLLWARLKTIDPTSDFDQIATIRTKISEIPPEDRHTPTYYFVRGLYFKMNSEFENSIKSFDHAVSLDATFIEARRELTSLKREATSTKTNLSTLLHGDLKDVMTGIFSRTQSKAR